NGNFPDLGWHVAGEMGGIWTHPIKLMDGFPGNLTIGEESFCLDNAERFIHFSMSTSTNYRKKGSRSKDSILFQWIKRRFS
ncbi:MAG: hypothetical protein ACJAXX_001708, partial [Roseivirga sp.]